MKNQGHSHTKAETYVHRLGSRESEIHKNEKKLRRPKI